MFQKSLGQNLGSPQAGMETFAERRQVKNPELYSKISAMKLTLFPLVQLTTGEVHPRFPRTILQFWLLTNSELEEIAHFYHQRTPCHLTDHYPVTITWSSDLSLEEKRRKIGKFVGLRGCESPT